MKISLLCSLFAAVSLVSIGTLYAQTDAAFTNVDHVLWVVKDVKAVKKGWTALGFTEIRDMKTVNCLSYGFKEVKSNVKVSAAALGGLNALWVEPVSGENVFSKALSKNGEGAIALIHKVASPEQLAAIISTLAQANIGKIATFSLETKEGDLKYTIMDTREQGKYYLGFVIDERTGISTPNGNNLQNLTFNQYAFAIKDPAGPSAFWASAGLPPFEITHGELWDKEYFGKPSGFDMNLGWQRHGSIVYEWCIPLKSPTVYEDHIRVHGEGIQHFGFATSDMDAAIKFFTGKGYKVSMSGGWGEKGKAGSGRFTYIDLSKIGGMTIELLWSQN